MRIASDLHPELIAMWRALQTGWEPPAVVTESEYQLIRAGTDMALRGFVGFGCSNSGKWFGGYARNKTGRNYASNARNSLKKKMMGLGDVRFECGGYNEVEVPSGSLIYCDPPYRGTVGYSVGRFDHDRFWEWVRKRSVENTVLVSEYSAPEDFTCVWEIETKTDIKDRTGEKSRRVEQLFEHSSSVE
jgi:DNA adenine methylase